MKLSLVDQALGQICALIAEEKLKPGQPITHRELAACCGMSTVPIAAAFKRLENEGIIITRPRRGGSNIALIGLDELWDSVQLRLAIEQRALLLVMESATSEDLDELMTAARNAEWKRGDNAREWASSEFNFHNTLLNCAHSPLLLRQNWVLFDYQLKAKLCPALQLLRIPEDIDPDDDSGSGHVKLAELIITHDPRAPIMLEAHVISSINHPRFNRKIAEAKDFINRIFAE